jgi:S-adenosylmethionine:tRNA ribosyltransferase-isomerase
VIAPAAGGIAHALHFELGDERAASTPPEARGLARDEVRLLVAEGASIEHARFRALHRLLRAGDLLVVNTTATLPAAVDAQRTGGRVATVHFSTALDDGTWIVEVRPAAHATGPVDDAAPGERLLLPGDVALTLLWPYPDAAAARPRLWRARLSRGEVADVLRRHGRPITYAYVTGEWPLEYYQTVFARHPGSAEMPSAARPFSDRLATALISAGVAFAPVLLHTGVSSLETGEAPLAEPFHVPASSAARVNATRTAGGRIIAVGTTSARALESATDARGMVVPRRGWTDLVLGPDRAARVLDGLITGWHAPGASHLHLLEAVVGPELVQHAYQEALFAGYLWHEFGDSCLLLR